MNKLNLLALKAQMKIQMIMEREEGQDLIEYALLAGLISLAAVVAIKSLSTDISGLFNTVGSTLNNS